MFFVTAPAIAQPDMSAVHRQLLGPAQPEVQEQLKASNNCLVGPLEIKDDKGRRIFDLAAGQTYPVGCNASGGTK
jgi:hypothetical protein